MLVNYSVAGIRIAAQKGGCSVWCLNPMWSHCSLPVTSEEWNASVVLVTAVWHGYTWVYLRCGSEVDDAIQFYIRFILIQKPSVPVLIDGPLRFVDVSRFKQVRSEHISARKGIKCHARNDKLELLKLVAVWVITCHCTRISQKIALDVLLHVIWLRRVLIVPLLGSSKHKSEKCKPILWVYRTAF